MAYNYQNPGWANGGPPPLNATNLNAISTTLQAIGTSFDNGGDPAYLWGGYAVYNNFVSISGAAGAITSLSQNNMYVFTAASTIMMPSSPYAAQIFTFKNKGNFTSTISANSGQTIGTTSSTSFSLYAQEDYVTLEWDGTSIWYVVATNGPVISSDQNSSATGLVGSSWTSPGIGLSLSIPVGVWDFTLECTIITQNGGQLSIAIGNGTTPISGKVATGFSTVYTATAVSVSVKGYAITSLSTISLIYYSSGAGGNQIIYQSAGVPIVGRISARRIG